MERRWAPHLRTTDTRSPSRLIATVYELRRGLAVHGDERYLEPFKRFSCYGHPITHPVTRRLEGVEEIFGPVLSLIAYDDVDDAVRIANDSDFGLGGTVWTADPERGAAVARSVHTGTIGVNRYIPDPAAPFDGVKASGLGRELGPEGLTAYQQTQTVYL
ncbi:aldehyde dehydrogenase family protein [Streptomyces cavernae]|uniref:aldehyde dehydrogenase family protein n=1 Tax=Streptomyces cavernae TaxID=2259034 RepID=UPI003B75C06C